MLSTATFRSLRSTEPRKSYEFLREPQGLLATSRAVSEGAEHSKRIFFDRFPAFPVRSFLRALHPNLELNLNHLPHPSQSTLT
jgi:hypothetical protein